VIAYEKINGGVGELEWQSAQVVALAAKHRLREARQHRQAFASHARTLPDGATWWGDPIAKFLPMAEAEMDARLAWAEGNRAASIEFWRKAVDAQDRLMRSEGLLSWFHPVRESLGAALYHVADYGEAEQVFRADLRSNPNNPRSLFGLWQSLVAQRRDTEAQDAKGQFDLAWRDADFVLTIEGL
jgi:tetratricopeptide (TPR) repeat protein